jgi:hypothetical protein
MPLSGRWFHAYLVDDVNRAAIEKRTEIRDDRFNQTSSRFFCRPGDVGRDDTVFCVQQRIIERWRLAGKNIHSRARQDLLHGRRE